MWSSPCCQCSALRSSRLTHSSSWWSRVDGTALSVSAPDPTESAEQSPLVAIRCFASLLPRVPTVPPRPDGRLLYLFNLSDRTLLHRVVYRSIVRTPAGEPAPSLTFRTIAFTLGEQHRSATPDPVGRTVVLAMGSNAVSLAVFPWPVLRVWFFGSVLSWQERLI